MNEFDFIRRLRDQARTRKHSARLVTGIGDDAAVISQFVNRDLIITTDLLIEGVDFYRDAAPARTRAGIGRAFQLTNLFPGLPVVEIIIGAAVLAGFRQAGWAVAALLLAFTVLLAGRIDLSFDDARHWSDPRRSTRPR